MSFEAEQTQQDNLQTYRSLVRQAGQINGLLTEWEGQFQTLRAAVPADKQAELDTRKTAFVSALRNTLGI